MEALHQWEGWSGKELWRDHWVNGFKGIIQWKVEFAVKCSSYYCYWLPHTFHWWLGFISLSFSLPTIFSLSLSLFSPHITLPLSLSFPLILYLPLPSHFSWHLPIVTYDINSRSCLSHWIVKKGFIIKFIPWQPHQAISHKISPIWFLRPFSSTAVT